MDEEATLLRTFREAQTPKLPLKALAAQLGMTEGQLSRIERNGTGSFKTALRLAELTGLPVESFRPRDAAAKLSGEAAA